MKFSSNTRREVQSRRGIWTVDVAVALGLVVVTLIPISLRYFPMQKLFRGYYFHSVATEIVDGELEILAAGEWKRFPLGTNEYQVQARAAKQLPEGRFELVVSEERVRLSWHPIKLAKGGPVIREFTRKGAHEN